MNILPPPPPPPRPPVPPPPARIDVECDTECAINYWLIKFRFPDGSYLSFDKYSLPNQSKDLDIASVINILQRTTIYTFNGIGYDLPMIVLALSGASNITLKEANDLIIVRKMKWWDLLRYYGLEIPKWIDHVDLKEVAPGVGISLKMYGGRGHSKTMRDLPFDPAAVLTYADMVETDDYCGNDLEITHDLRMSIKERINLRVQMGKRFNTDLRSKSDAQGAEAVIKAQIPFKAYPPVWAHGMQFFYKAPEYVSFKTAELQEVLRLVTTTPFIVYDVDQIKTSEDDEFFDADGKKIKTGVKLPAIIKNHVIKFGASKYQIGIGGLHSKESKVKYRTIPGKITISDHDVTSYYPSLILLLKMLPPAIGSLFNDIFQGMYKDRLAAKEYAAKLEKLDKTLLDSNLLAEQKTIADGLKIFLNGTFGKTGSKHSVVYAPDMMIQITITGQLCILMLIEMMELSGIPVISANTDGIVLLVEHGMEWIRDSNLRWWENVTGLGTEATFYDALWSRDINNYIALKPDGKLKRKGVFGKSGILENKHPCKDICADAVCEYLTKAVPLETTIYACTDIKKFLVVRNVKGGGYKDGVYLGKAVRWYYGTNGGCIRYAIKEGQTIGNKVASSDGAVPLMELIDHMPNDVDYQHYIDEAKTMLLHLGVQ